MATSLTKNPFENLWSQLKEDVADFRETNSNLPLLRENVLKMWNEIIIELLQKLLLMSKANYLTLSHVIDKIQYSTYCLIILLINNISDMCCIKYNDGMYLINFASHCT